MSKPKSKKRGALEGASPFVLVRSKTGRAFQRIGIRFPHDRDEPVNLDKLTEEQRATLLGSAQHLSIEYVGADEYELALKEAADAEPEAQDERTFEEVLKENEQLKQDVADLRAEISLLTGRRKDPNAGPREGDKPKSAGPLMG